MHLKEGTRNCACANSGKDIFEPSPPVLTVSRQIWCVTILDQKLAGVRNLETRGVKSGGEISGPRSRFQRAITHVTFIVGPWPLAELSTIDQTSSLPSFTPKE